MRCPHCKGSISAYNFFREKLCPACEKPLKQMPTKEQVKEFMISFAEDTGYIFWSIVYLLMIWVVAFFEQIFGKGLLFEYISNHEFRFFFLAVFSGSIIDYVAKANVEITAVRNKFIFRPPLYLRAFRNWTNIALIIGLGLSWYVQYRWPNYISHLVTYTMIPSFLLCLIWALMGITVSNDHMQDKRIKYFLGEMRVEKYKKYNRASVIYIGGFFISCITYYWLVNISGLWFYISNSRFVYNLTTFFRLYFGWTKQFLD